MKTKLLLSISLVLATFFTRAQCANTQTANITITNTTVLTPGSNGVVLICSTGMLYDTLQNSSVIRYYLEPGAKLIVKNGSTLLIAMKATSSFTNYGYPPFNKMVYAEPGATMVTTGTVPINPTTCSVVSFPASPLCAPTTISEKSNLSNLTSFFPNPAKNNLTIINDNSAVLHASVINALGQKVRSFIIETGKKNVDVSDLPGGLYYLSLSENGKVISTKKLVIAK
ncbi:MAG: T9SS type A sorting domain-containing protein [Bacteroidota bacterium]|nr:T9SS type A sorting domain-containing protein [Bacteroidota bacterium]